MWGSVSRPGQLGRGLAAHPHRGRRFAGAKNGRFVPAIIPNLFINIMALQDMTWCKLFIVCKIMAWLGFEAFSSDFGALNSYYLLHFHKHIGIIDKLFIFINILAKSNCVVFCHLFSIRSWEQPSFLTSFCVRAPCLIFINKFGAHLCFWTRDLRASLRYPSGRACPFRSQQSAFSNKRSAYPFLIRGPSRPASGR